MNFNRLMKSNNPMIKEQVVTGGSPITRTGEGSMTVSGGANKSLILFGLMLMTAVVGFTMPSQLFMYGGIFGGMAISFIASRSPEKSSIWAPLFALVYGLAIGTITAIYGARYNGIIFQAVTITMSIFFAMLFLYKSGLITVTDKFRSVIMTLMGGIMILYLVSFGMHMFGYDMPFLHDQSMIGVGISCVIALVASLKLLVDFDNFDRGAKSGSPKYMEWYISMGLLFTLIWLYTEILYIVGALMGSE